MVLLNLTKLSDSIYSGKYSADPKFKDSVQFPPMNSKENLKIIITHQDDLNKIRSYRKFYLDDKNIEIYESNGNRVQRYSKNFNSSGSKIVNSPFKWFFQLEPESDFFNDLNETDEVIFYLPKPALYKKNLDNIQMRSLLNKDLVKYNNYNFKNNKITFFTDKSFWNDFSQTLKLSENSVIYNIINNEKLAELYKTSNFSSLGKLMNYIFGIQLGGDEIPQYISIKFSKGNEINIVHPNNNSVMIYSKTSGDYDEIKIECITDGKEHEVIFISSESPINFENKIETNFLQDFDTELNMHKKHKNLRNLFGKADNKIEFLSTIAHKDYHSIYNKFNQSDDSTKKIIIKYFELYLIKLSNDFYQILNSSVNDDFGINTPIFNQLRSKTLGRQFSGAYLNLEKKEQ